MSKKSELIDRIKRQLGYPLIRLELVDAHYEDAIRFALNKFKRWAVGQSVQEVWLTLQLSGGIYEYELPTGVTEVIGYTADSSGGGINTLFSTSNMLYNQGTFDSILSPQGDSFNLVTYEISLQFLETLQKYTPDIYNYKYHSYQNILELHPCPAEDEDGYILLRTMMVEPSTYSGYGSIEVDDNQFYESDWLESMAVARCKQALGMIRRKFASFSSLGNQSLSLDGDVLITEGKQEQADLMESLKTEECWTGMSISMG